MTSALALGLMMIGICLFVFRQRRRFRRTNEMGIERFDSYTAKLRGQTTDLLLTIAAGVLFVGGVVLLSNEHVDTWGWIVMVPVLGFVLFLIMGV